MPSLDALPIAKAQAILCGYRNETPAIQVIRITNIADWYFERVVFPGAWLLLALLNKGMNLCWDRHLPKFEIVE